MIYATVALVVRTLPLPNLPALLVAASQPYVAPLLLLALITLALGRRPLLAVLTAVVLTVSLAMQLPWGGRSGTDIGTHLELHVLESNLRHGHADAAFLTALAESSADIVMSPN
ncbi:hypothetical protein [Mycobacterium sp. C31M]